MKQPSGNIAVTIRRDFNKPYTTYQMWKWIGTFARIANVDRDVAEDIFNDIALNDQTRRMLSPEAFDELKSYGMFSVTQLHTDQQNDGKVSVTIHRNFPVNANPTIKEQWVNNFSSSSGLIREAAQEIFEELNDHDYTKWLFPPTTIHALARDGFIVFSDEHGQEYSESNTHVVDKDTEYVTFANDINFEQAHKMLGERLINCRINQFKCKRKVWEQLFIEATGIVPSKNFAVDLFDVPREQENQMFFPLTIDQAANCIKYGLVVKGIGNSDLNDQAHDDELAETADDDEAEPTVIHDQVVTDSLANHIGNLIRDGHLYRAHGMLELLIMQQDD